jgi:hypothetical protein
MGQTLASVLTLGYPAEIREKTGVSTTTVPVAAAGTQVSPGVGRVAVLTNTPKILDVYGNVTYQSSTPSIDLGDGHTRSLPRACNKNPARGRARGRPRLTPKYLYVTCSDRHWL